MNFVPISFPFFVSGIFLLLLAHYAWRRQSVARSANVFGLFLLAIGIYTIGYAFELTSPDLETALLWSKVQYVGILTYPVFFIFFVFQYQGRADQLNARLKALMFIPAVFFYAVKLFDQNLNWIYATADYIEVAGRLVLSFDWGPLYLFVSLYQVITVSIGIVLIIQRRRHSSQLYRRQTGIMLLSASFVYLVYLFYILSIPLPGLEGIDIIPLSFSVLGIGVSIAIFRYGLLDVVPVARDTLIEILNDGVLVLDRYSRVVDANPRAAEIFGWKKSPYGELAEKRVADWLSPAFLDDLIDTCKQELELPGEKTSSHYEVTISLLTEENDTRIGYLVLIHDISEQKQVEQMLAELSLSDELTGLYNRRGLNVLGEQLLGMAVRMELNAILFYCDIDGLKIINDTLGHAVGDRAIRDAGSILKDSFRSSDVVARIGGDEFVLLGLESTQNSSSMMLERLDENLAEHAKLGRPFELSISTGMAQYNWRDPKTLQNLLEEADQAMYKVKEAKQKNSSYN